ncbi:MAG: DUF3568 family protein, partial [Lentisphaerae bacterium]|nr:DUF3568 family protein [Lentisphaerota bacterium]
MERATRDTPRARSGLPMMIGQKTNHKTRISCWTTVLTACFARALRCPNRKRWLPREPAGTPSAAGGVIVALLCAVFVTGCSALVGPVIVGAGGAAAEAYWRGERDGYVDAPLWQCEQAVPRVAEYFNLRIVQCRDSGAAKVFQLRNVQDTPFWIKIEPLSSDCTRVGIR